MDEILRLENLSKRFDNVVAVASVSLSIYHGEFLAILGPSGSGKTTILRMIAGFERPDSGRIIFDGEDIADVPVNKRPFNTVFQDYALFPNMNVFHNVAYGLSIRRVDRRETRERVHEALDMVALPGYGERYPDQLSGGQRQRVALARALILRPRLLLLDEPLGALDLALRKLMQITLKQIQEKVGITFIHVTHDQEEGLSISDRVAIVHRGLLQQVDKPRKVYFQPSNSFTAGFMGENNMIGGRITSIDSEQVCLDSPIGRIRSRRCITCEGMGVGDDATIIIRPENILVGSAAASAANRFNAVVRRRVFSGSEEKMLVATEAAPALELMIKLHFLSIQHDDRSIGLEDSAGVQVGWSPDNCWIVGAERTTTDA
jgi:spermidine/putrescine transport system ATP-binding protein